MENRILAGCSNAAPPLIDDILRFEFGKRIVAVKNANGNDPWLGGHFPGNAIMPGAVMIEAGIQCVRWLFEQSGIDGEKYRFCRTINGRFSKPIFPGDRIVLDAQVESIAKTDVVTKLTFLVENEVRASGKLIFGDESSSKKKSEKIQGRVTGINKNIDTGDIDTIWQNIAGIQSAAKKNVYGFNELRQLLPQQEPFIFVDRVCDLREGKSILCLKNVSAAETWCYARCSGQRPCLAEPIVLEALAQASILLVFYSYPKYRNNVAVFSSIYGELTQSVQAGEQLILIASIQKIISVGGVVNVKAVKDDQAICSANMVFGIIDRNGKMG